MPRKQNEPEFGFAGEQRGAGFRRDLELVKQARENTFRTVNTALIDLYWQIGQTLSRRVQAAEWGEGVVDRLAAYLSRTQPGLRGFTRANLFRMRQFYENYREDEKVAPLVRRLSLDAQPHHPRAEQTQRRTRVLPSACDPGELEQAGARTPDGRGSLRAHNPNSQKSHHRCEKWEQKR